MAVTCDFVVTVLCVYAVVRVRILTEKGCKERCTMKRIPFRH
jgi:hypothetical protein